MMPRGPKGEWRPADPIRAGRPRHAVLPGEIEETYEPPADQPKPTSPSREWSRG